MIFITMVKSSETKENKDFDETALMKIEKGQSTLPIQVAAEWTKGYKLINKVISMMNADTFVETYEDDVGKDRRRTHIHSQLLPFLQERRRMADQIWKFVGGEAINEGRKKIMHNMADIIFQMTQDDDFLEKHKDKIQDILEIVPDAD